MNDDGARKRHIIRWLVLGVAAFFVLRYLRQADWLVALVLVYVVGTEFARRLWYSARGRTAPKRFGRKR